MPSNINPANINGNYPVAGQDNDSQGFRDNFTNIRSNLNFAKSEIEDLQNKAILKAPLSGTGSVTNELNGSIISGARLRATSETFINLVPIGTIVNVDFTLGHHQSLSMGADPLTISITGFPINNSAKLNLYVQVTDVASTLTFPNNFVGDDNSNALDAAGWRNIYGAANNTVTFPGVGYYIFELSVVDSVYKIRELTGKLAQTADRGSFSPNLAGASSYTAGGQVGYYVRNGNQISFTSYLSTTTATLVAGVITLAGLPVSANNSINSPVVVSNVTGFAALANQCIIGHVAPNTNVVTLQKTTGGAASALTIASATVTIAVSGSYFI